MIILDATTKSLELFLGEAATTELPIVSSWVDITTTAMTPGSTDTTSNDTTDVTIVAAPGASTYRHVKLINIYNADSVSHVVNVQYDNNGTERLLVKITLPVGYTLIYTDGEGWRALSSTGALVYGSALNITGTPADNQIAVWTSANTIEGTSTFTFDGTTFTTTGQIAFPATQSASSGANTLDDYEEGTFTPTLTSAGGSGIAYTTQLGGYVKIGKLVYATIWIVLSSKGTASGAIGFGALPFTVYNTSAGFYEGTLAPFHDAAVNSIFLFPFPLVNTTTASIGVVKAAGLTCFTSLDAADIAATFGIRCCLLYEASA